MPSPTRFPRGLIAASVAACLVLLYSSKHRTAPAPEPASPVSMTVAPKEPDEPKWGDSSTPVSTTPSVPSAEPGIEPPPLKLDTIPALGEQQLTNTIAGRTDPTAKARAIFASIPHLPEEALSAAAEEAVKNLPDANYVAVALPVVTNEHTHGQVMSVLFADLMERPDPIALPALLTIARNSSHPLSANALNNLKLLLRESHGNDWSAWSASVQKRLAAAPK